jgi:hypothetical protein
MTHATWPVNPNHRRAPRFQIPEIRGSRKEGLSCRLAFTYQVPVAWCGGQPEGSYSRGKLGAYRQGNVCAAPFRDFRPASFLLTNPSRRLHKTRHLAYTTVGSYRRVLPCDSGPLVWWDNFMGMGWHVFWRRQRLSDIY